MGITVGSFLEKALLLRTLGCFLTSFVKQAIQMRIDIKARLERVLSRIGCHLGAIEVQLFAPHESRRLTLLHYLLKEATKALNTIALTDACETGMVRQWLIQIVAKIPPDAQPICRMPHQLAFGTYSLEEHHELQLEEDHRIDGGTPCTRVGLFHELIHKGEIK